MKLIRLRSILLATSFACTLEAQCLDLPVKTINGQQYYYYYAEGNESVHGVSKKLGLTREQIVQYNPGVADGIRRGTILYFPVSDFAEVEIEEPQAPYETISGETVKVDTVDDVNSETSATLTATVDETSRATTSDAQLGATVVLALPFNLKDDDESRSSRLATDFYKGFLIAADSLSYRNTDITIKAVDSTDSTALAECRDADAAIVIAPDDAATLSQIAKHAAERGTYILNLFNVRDTTYKTNPYIIQANIPAEMMYVKAVQGLRQTYPGYTPVIIRNTSGRNEKEAFTRYLSATFDSLGLSYLHIDYSGNLTTSDLQPIEADSVNNFVIVPSGGSLSEFNKFAYVIRNLRDSRERVEQNDDDSTIGNIGKANSHQHIAVFGYPDWLTFRSDAEEILHDLEATIYSRFYDNYDGFDCHNIESDFIRWYGEPMMETVPSQGLLGFDVGNYLIKAMRNGSYDPKDMPNYRGVQSTFYLQRVNGGGYVNTALYILQFQPYGRMNATVL